MGYTVYAQWPMIGAKSKSQLLDIHLELMYNMYVALYCNHNG